MEKAQKGDLIRIIPHEGNGYIGEFYEVGDVFEVFRRDDDDGILIESERADDGDGDKKLYVYDIEYVIHRKAGEEDSTEVSACASCGAEVVEGEAVTPPAIKYDTTYAATDAQIRLANDIEPTDAVNPQHYKQGRVEVIDIIEDAVEGADPFEAVCQANVLKYALRYRHKNGVEDLRKSIWYTEKLIAYLDAKSTQDKTE